MISCLGALCLVAGLLAVDLQAAIVVRTDQVVYQVMPGESFQIEVHIDNDDQTLGSVYEPIPNGLFSYGISLSYPLGLATVPSVADITPAVDLDYFGFSAGAMEQVTANSAMVKGNINQAFIIPYSGSLLARFQVTNLASAPSTYLVHLDEWRTLGPTEQIFLDGSGRVLDTVPSSDLFRGALIQVIPEPNGLFLCLIWGLLSAVVSRQRGARGPKSRSAGA